MVVRQQINWHVHLSGNSHYDVLNCADSMAVSGTVVTVSSTLYIGLPMSDARKVPDLRLSEEELSGIHRSAELSFPLDPRLLEVSFTNESGTVLPLDNCWRRLDLELLVSLTKELATTSLGFESFEPFEGVLLANESGTMRLGLESLLLLEGVSSTRLSDTWSTGVALPRLWRFLRHSSLNDVSGANVSILAGSLWVTRTTNNVLTFFVEKQTGPNQRINWPVARGRRSSGRSWPGSKQISQNVIVWVSAVLSARLKFLCIPTCVQRSNHNGRVQFGAPFWKRCVPRTPTRHGLIWANHSILDRLVQSTSRNSFKSVRVCFLTQISALTDFWLQDY